MNRTFRIVSALIIILIAIYFLGPSPDFEPVSNEPGHAELLPGDVEGYVRDHDPLDIRPGNNSVIFWADSIRKTPYSIVYLHGFSASPMEGDPIHRNLAKRFGFNLYAPLQTGHGLKDPDAFMGLTPAQMVESAREAIAIGKTIGEKVILLATSTGATLSIFLAANDPAVAALVLMSPNIQIYDPAAFLLDMPWGKQIANVVIGSDYRTIEYPEEAQPYWYSRYHNDGLIALQRLLDETMTEEVFSSIEMPVFMGYYYKNDEEMDKVVSVEAMQDFFESIATPDDMKKAVAFADGTNHVISSSIKNPNWRKVQIEIEAFLSEKVLEP